MGGHPSVLAPSRMAASVTDVDERGASRLHYASQGGSHGTYSVAGNPEEVVMQLLQFGASANAPDQYGETPLHWAVRADQAGIGEVLLVWGGADVNRQDFYGYAPIHSVQSVSLLKLLLRHGATLTTPSGSILHTVCQRPAARGSGSASLSPAFSGHYSGKATLIEALLEAGASPCMYNKAGQLPMDIILALPAEGNAAIAEREEVLKLLKRHQRHSRDDGSFEDGFGRMKI